MPLFQTIEMPSNPFELPIEGTDPKVYFVPETSDEAHLSLGAGNPIPNSKVGSGKVTLNAKKLALRVGFSSELVEDAVIPVLNIYRQQAVRAIADAIDNVLLNGDTTTSNSGNINRDHSAPPATAKYLSMDGMRHLPLIDKTANRVNLNAAPGLAKMREARFKMPGKYAARPTDLAWIVDSGTYAKLLGIDEFLTMDKAGPLATAQTGADRLGGRHSGIRLGRDALDGSGWQGRRRDQRPRSGALRLSTGLDGGLPSQDRGQR